MKNLHESRIFICIFLLISSIKIIRQKIADAIEISFPNHLFYQAINAIK